MQIDYPSSQNSNQHGELKIALIRKVPQFNQSDARSHMVSEHSRQLQLRQASQLLLQQQKLSQSDTANLLQRLLTQNSRKQVDSPITPKTPDSIQKTIVNVDSSCTTTANSGQTQKQITQDESSASLQQVHNEGPYHQKHLQQSQSTVLKIKNDANNERQSAFTVIKQTQNSSQTDSVDENQKEPPVQALVERPQLVSEKEAANSSWEGNNYNSDDQSLSFEQINQRFEILFACFHDRRRLFEDYSPQFNYRDLVILAFQKQSQIMENLHLTQQEIRQLRGSVSIIELQNDQARESDFQSALRGIDITTGGQSQSVDGENLTGVNNSSAAQRLKEKRHRRNAGQIIRDNVCQHCFKSYGSEGSLNQHIKLKHPVEARLKIKSKLALAEQQSIDHLE